MWSSDIMAALLRLPRRGVKNERRSAEAFLRQRLS
jgi:hypothetical protein